MLENQAPDLLILDVMLPEEDGLSVLRKLRGDERFSNLPVIMLTAKSSEFDKVTALDLGADDYVTKPFGVMELVARVNALLRRSGAKKEKQGTIHRYGELFVSVEKHEVTVAGEPILLTLKEFELLCLFLENRGTVLTRDRILSEVWGYNFDGENRTVDVHIRTLRQKLGEEYDFIETVRGVGYKMSDK
jgi:two-component system alkaline phosphatase synthesis response regulator PhoP